MGKISPVSSKYIVHSTIEVDGVVDKPDVIGAIFGQTEGLLGSELELRELQRSGRIGRIEVEMDTRSGKSKGTIIIPSSLDQAETVIIAAALEIIQRIGPCNAKVKVEKIEDVRISKRTFVIERAKELLRGMIDTVLPDSQEIMDEVANSVRVMEATEYGRERLPAGPAVEESEEIIVVEGRADVLNLLRNGFKNVIAINGTSVPQTLIELSKQKDLTAFVDGDRGGNLIIKELLAVVEVDFVTRAPDGKEVEELTKKEIHKALRSKITAEQARFELGDAPTILKRAIISKNLPPAKTPITTATSTTSRPTVLINQGVPPAIPGAVPNSANTPNGKRMPTQEEGEQFSKILEGLIGTRGACLLDEKMSVLGKVPLTELLSTIKTLRTGVHTVILDGVIDIELVQVLERANVKFAVGMDTKVRPNETRVGIITVADL